MSRFSRWLLLILCAASLAAVGCGGTPTPSRTRTPAQYFKDQQASTITPHGRIMIDSVEEKDGKIQYKTEDGKQWRVSYSNRPDSTYQYGMPEEAK